MKKVIPEMMYQGIALYPIRKKALGILVNPNTEVKIIRMTGTNVNFLVTLSRLVSIRFPFIRLRWPPQKQIYWLKLVSDSMTPQGLCRDTWPIVSHFPHSQSLLDASLA